MIHTIGIVGSGVMGNVFAGALKKAFPNISLIVCDKNPSKTRTLQKKYAITRADIVSDLAHADIIILAIKPQDFSSVQLAVRPSTFVISIMAGVSVTAIKKHTGAQKIVRAMPNTPARFGKGFTAWFATPAVMREGRAFCTRLFQAMGVEMQVKRENDINAATAITGSGPAYILYTAFCFMEAARELGFSKKQAQRMVAQVISGVDALLSEGADPETLITQVASKGGTTEAALRKFASLDILDIWKKAINTAYTRAQELARITR